jgi:hypothetical protein
VSHSRRRDRVRRAFRLEPLEARDLLSVLVTHHVGAPHRGIHARAALTPATQVGITNVPQGPSGTPTAPLPDAAGGLPTSHEVRRQTYVARFKGNYIIGPGRFTDQAAQLGSNGYGGSTFDFHLWSNMRLVDPTDPAVAPTGQMYLIPWHVGTTGSQLYLDLTGDRATAVNGFPTHYTWTVDPASSGLYANATGQGTLDIKFFRPGPGPQPGMQQGQLQYAINGFVNVTGISNVIGVLGNLPNGKRYQGPAAPQHSPH